MKQPANATALLILLALAAQTASFSQYAGTIDSPPDLFQLWLAPTSCEEFLEIPTAQPAGFTGDSEAQQAKELYAQSQAAALNAKSAAEKQKYYWVAGITMPVFYTYFSIECHAQASLALQKAVQASRRALASLDRQVGLLEQSAQGATGRAGGVLAQAESEEQALNESTNGVIAGKLREAELRTKAAWANALSESTGIANATNAQYALSRTVLDFTAIVFDARTQAERQALAAQAFFEGNRQAAKACLDFTEKERLSMVADEWFTVLSSPSQIVSSNSPGYSTSLEVASLSFEQASQTAGQAAQPIASKTQGWAGKALELYAQANANLSVSFAACSQARQMALELAQAYQKQVAAQALALAQQAPAKAATNPYGAANALYRASQTQKEAEKLAIEPIGRKIAGLRQILEENNAATRLLQSEPKFGQALASALDAIADAQSTAKDALQSGIQTKGEQEKLSKLSDALEKLKASGQEDYAVAAATELEAKQVGKAIQSRVQAEFSQVPELLSTLTQLEEFLDEKDRENLALAKSTLENSSANSRKQTLEFARQAMASLQANSTAIIAQHLQHNAKISTITSLAQLGQPAQTEILWRSLHEIPLETNGEITVQMPLSDDIAQASIEEKSSAVLRLEGTALVLASSTFEQEHFASLNFTLPSSKLISKKHFTVAATVEELTTLDSVDFEVARDAPVVLEFSAPNASSAQVEATAPFEKIFLPQQGLLRIVIQATKGRHQVNATVHYSSPVSITRTSSAGATKLYVEFEARNVIAQPIEGLELEFNENLECAFGQISVKATSGKAALQKRSASAVATRITGITIVPNASQRFLLEIPCDDVARYAARKLSELSAADSILQLAGEELASAQNALFAGDSAKAVKLTGQAQQKLLDSTLAKEQVDKLSTQALSQANELQQAALELSVSAANCTLSSASQLSRAAQAALQAVGEAKLQITSGKDATTSLQQARGQLDSATKLLENELAKTSAQCSSSDGEADKAKACLKMKASALQAKEELFVQRPGAAVAHTQEAQQAIDQWAEQRKAKLQTTTTLLWSIRDKLAQARALAAKANDAIGNEKIDAAAPVATARKSLEALFAKAEDYQATLEKANEAKILSLGVPALQTLEYSFDQRYSTLQAALEQAQKTAQDEVMAAEKRSEQLGDAATQQKASQAREKLSGGSFITAYALARDVNSQLNTTTPRQGGWGSREILLAVSGIAILTILAYVFTKKPPQASEPDGKQFAQLASELQQGGETQK